MACLVLTGATVPFNDLVEGITPDLVEFLFESGFKRVEIQYGHAKEAFDYGPGRLKGVSGFAFDPDLTDRVKRARLIISHAGTGSIIDALRGNPKVPLIVVPNQSLMDNHQLEVANKLQQKYLLVSTTQELRSNVQRALNSEFDALPPPKSLDSVLKEVLS